MTYEVASGSPNVLRGVKLRMASMQFAPPSEAPPNQSTEVGAPAVNRLMDGFTLTVLGGAYVILIPLSDAVSSLAADAGNALLARTADDGEIRRIEPQEAEGSVPNASKAIGFEAGTTYSCFFSLDKAIFNAALEDVMADVGRAQDSHPFFQFQVAPHAHARFHSPERPDDAVLAEGLSELNRQKLELLLYDHDGDFDRSMIHGVFRGAVLSGLEPAGAISPDATYVVARTEALAALCVADLVHQQSLARRARTWEDWQFLHTAIEIAQSAQEGVVPDQLKESLDTYVLQGVEHRVTDPERRAMNARFVDYAFQCARKKVDRALFFRSLNEFVTQDGWHDAAREILKQHGVRHPGFTADGMLQFHFYNVKGVGRYFDFYEFGQRYFVGTRLDKVEAIEAQIAEAEDAVRARLASFLARRAPYRALLWDLAAHTSDVQRRKQLHARYLTLALGFRYRWWEDFHEIEKDRLWRTFKTYTGWISTLNDKLGELLGHVFGDESKVLAFNQMLGGRVDEFEQLFARMNKYNERFEGRHKTRALPDGTTFEADFERMVARVTTPDGKISVLEGLEFIVVTEEVPRAPRSPAKRGARGARVQRARAPRIKHSVNVVSPAFKKVRHWPVWMAAFGDFVALAFSLQDLGVAVKKQQTDLELIGKVGKDTFQFLSSGSAAFSVLLRRELMRKAAAAGVGLAGAGLEAFYNAREGYALVFDEESPAYTSGNQTVATLHYVKGWTLLVSTSVSTGLAAAAFTGVAAEGLGVLLATGAALTPLGIGLAVGAVVVVGLEVAIWQYAGPGSSMQGFEEALTKKLAGEFSADFKVSRTHDELMRFLGGADKVLSVLER